MLLVLLTATNTELAPNTSTSVGNYEEDYDIDEYMAMLSYDKVTEIIVPGMCTPNCLCHLFLTL